MTNVWPSEIEAGARQKTQFDAFVLQRLNQADALELTGVVAGVPVEKPQVSPLLEIGGRKSGEFAKLGGSHAATWPTTLYLRLDCAAAEPPAAQVPSSIIGICFGQRPESTSFFSAAR